LFVSSTDEPIDDEYRIYFGQALIKTSFKSGMLKIHFLEGKLPLIYTNITCLKKIGNGNKVKKKIDTSEEVIVYFRGKCKRNKIELFNYKNYKDFHFESFNDKNYKDLYFELDNDINI